MQTRQDRTRTDTDAPTSYGFVFLCDVIDTPACTTSSRRSLRLLGVALAEQTIQNAIFRQPGATTLHSYRYLAVCDVADAAALTVSVLTSAFPPPPPPLPCLTSTTTTMTNTNSSKKPNAAHIFLLCLAAAAETFAMPICLTPCSTSASTPAAVDSMCVSWASCWTTRSATCGERKSGLTVGDAERKVECRPAA